jgi:hypothetical protein
MATFLGSPRDERRRRQAGRSSLQRRARNPRHRLMNVEHRRGHNEAGLETEHRGAAALREKRKRQLPLRALPIASDPQCAIVLPGTRIRPPRFHLSSGAARRGQADRPQPTSLGPSTNRHRHHYYCAFRMDDPRQPGDPVEPLHSAHIHRSTKGEIWAASVGGAQDRPGAMEAGHPLRAPPGARAAFRRRRRATSGQVCP